jgi:hypothetical protein
MNITSRCIIKYKTDDIVWIESLWAPRVVSSFGDGVDGANIILFYISILFTNESKVPPGDSVSD